MRNEFITRNASAARTMNGIESCAKSAACLKLPAETLDAMRIAEATAHDNVYCATLKDAFHQTLRWTTSDVMDAIAWEKSAGAGPNIKRIANTKVVDVVTSCFSLRNVTVTGKSSPSTTAPVSMPNVPSEWPGSGPPAAIAALMSTTTPAAM